MVKNVKTSKTARKTPNSVFFKRLNKWADALESGEYTQTQGRLLDPATGGMCCLGVACDISKLGKWSKNGFYLGNGSLPSQEVVNYFGLETNEGFRLQEGKYVDYALPDLNDIRGLSFKKIAKYVRIWAKKTYGP